MSLSLSLIVLQYCYDTQLSYFRPVPPSFKPPHVYLIVYTFIRISKRLFDSPRIYSLIQTFIRLSKLLFSCPNVYSIPYMSIQLSTCLFDSPNVYPVVHMFTQLSPRLLGQSHVYQTSFTFYRSVLSIQHGFLVFTSYHIPFHLVYQDPFWLIASIYSTHWPRVLLAWLYSRSVSCDIGGSWLHGGARTTRTHDCLDNRDYTFIFHTLIEFGIAVATEV